MKYLVILIYIVILISYLIVCYNYLILDSIEFEMPLNIMNTIILGFLFFKDFKSNNTKQ